LTRGDGLGYKVKESWTGPFEIKDDHMAAPGLLTRADVGPSPADRPAPSVVVTCPDARPPAYQAAAGLARAGLLGRFLTGYYYRDGGAAGLVRRLAPGGWGRVLRRRHDPAIPAALVRPTYAYDVALRVENRLASGGRPALARGLARSRTRAFDRATRRQVERDRPDALFAFSDVGSGEALPRCRDLGIPVILSMVHGEVREEREVIAREAEAVPDFERLYLGDGVLDRGQLDWLHARRLRDVELADRVLVPSEHIAGQLVRHGTPRGRVRVVPYAADVRRFRPDPGKRHGPACTFLFAGGISLRKGVHHLLAAWQRVRRPGWRLVFLGAPPRDPGPLAGGLGGVELLGRLPHDEVAAVMAAADVFVFPSLFEGSAVVTYEALACGLPCVVTPNAGSVVRDGVEGFLTPAGDVDALASRMEVLGRDPALRAAMATAARGRAEAYDWPRYHAAVVEAVRSVVADPAPAGGGYG